MTAAEKKELAEKIAAVTIAEEGLSKAHTALDVPGSPHPRQHLKNLKAGYSYVTLRKIFSLCDYQYCFSIHNKVTYKAIDPGVKTLLSCCTLFVEEDVRTTKYAVSSKEYHEMIKSAMRRLVSLELSKRVLSEDVYERLKVLSSKAAVDESYEGHLNYVKAPVIDS